MASESRVELVFHDARFNANPSFGSVDFDNPVHMAGHIHHNAVSQ